MTDDTPPFQHAASPTSPPPRTTPRFLLILLIPLALFAGVVLLFALRLTSGDPGRLPSALVGKPIPASIFPAIEGLRVAEVSVPGFSSADLTRGEVSVVNFWASWCRPCVEEHPWLGALAERSGVAVYGVNYKDAPESARRFLGRHGNPFTATGADPSGRGAIEWGVYGMPETFVVDGRGRIVYKHVGPLDGEALMTKVLPAIAAAKAHTPARN